MSQASPYSFENRIVTGSGMIRWVHEIGIHDTDAEGTICRTRGYVFDITEAKKDKFALQESEKKFRECMESLPVGVLIVDCATHTIRFSNNTFASCLGTTPDEIIGNNIVMLHPEEMRDFISKEFEKHRQVENHHSHCVPFKYADAPLVYFDILSRVYVFNDEETIIGIFTPIKNILDRSDVIEKILNYDNHGIVISDHTGNIVWVNNAWCDITGYSRDEVIDENPRFLKSGIQDEVFYKNMWSTLLENGYWSGEVWNRRRDGSLMCEMLTLHRIGHPELDNVLHIGIILDISELRILQRKLDTRINHAILALQR